jgi:hypothetical protein
VKHIFALTNAIAVLGLVLLTFGALIFCITLPMLVLGMRGIEAVILYSPIPILIGLYLVRQAGKLASAIIQKSSGWTGNTGFDGERPINKPSRTRTEAIALTVIGLLLIVGALSSVVAWLYNELFDDSMRRYLSDSILSRRSIELKGLLSAIVQFTIGIFFLTGQRVILPWLKKYHKAEEDYTVEKIA